MKKEYRKFIKSAENFISMETASALMIIQINDPENEEAIILIDPPNINPSVFCKDTNIDVKLGKWDGIYSQQNN